MPVESLSTLVLPARQASQDRLRGRTGPSGLGNLTIDELADAMTTASAIEEEVTHSRTETTVDRPEIESSINGDVGPSTCHRPESVLPKARGT